MTTYKALKGKKVKFFTSDPPGTVAEGQVWYNSTAQDYKTSVKVEAWASGGNMGTARSTYEARSSAGTQTASLAISGYTNTNVTVVESYNGTAWSEIADVNTARRDGAGAGSATSAIIFGGYISAASKLSEEWNGTSWSVVNSMGTARRNLGGAGTQAAAIAFAGAAPGNSAATEEYSVSHLKTIEIDGV